MTTEPTREEIEALLVRTEIALSAALNVVDGDGCPPDWDYLRLVKSQLAALTSRPAPAAEFTLAKRPVAFRVQNPNMTGWSIYQDEERAAKQANDLGIDYQGLFVRDGTPLIDAPAAEVAGERVTLAKRIKDVHRIFHNPPGGLTTNFTGAELAIIINALLATPSPDAAQQRAMTQEEERIVMASLRGSTELVEPLASPDAARPYPHPMDDKTGFSDDPACAGSESAPDETTSGELVRGTVSLPRLYRCNICGFMVDASYAAEKPTAGFSMPGRHVRPSPEPSVQEGWQLVPKAPTPEMIQSGYRSDPLSCDVEDTQVTIYGTIYEAMLAAAPQPKEKS